MDDLTRVLIEALLEAYDDAEDLTGLYRPPDWMAPSPPDPPQPPVERAA